MSEPHRTFASRPRSPKCRGERGPESGWHDRGAGDRGPHQYYARKSHFFGNEYTVDRGFIAFYNPIAIDPRIDISLETTVESVTVTLNVNGPMNNLKLSYQSDPPLEFQDIVGLLVVSGKRPVTSDPNIVATEPAPLQQSLGQMGETAIVTQAVASPLSSRLQRVFGVNQLRIDPTFASGSALPQTRLSLQQQVANSITFTYTQDLSQSNSELVRVGVGP